MRLAFAHHGLQFFFLTFCVRGRLAVLARLVEGGREGKCEDDLMGGQMS